MSADAMIERPSQSASENPVLFWGCFLALVTTAFGFIARMFLIDTWAKEFDLDPARSGELAGIGIWPFAVSIIGFSLLIDRIGYKASMIIAFIGHITWAIMGVSAYFVSQGGDKHTGFQLLYWGSLILALGNGTVEAFINPVVATMFSRAKTKWLNILHAGWPGGLVVAGMVTIFIDHVPWWIKVGLIAAPAVGYFVMLFPMTFPVQERVSSGVSYKDMLSEFGVLGAMIVGFLITLQLIEFFSFGGALSMTEKGIFIGIGIAIVVAFGIYTQSAGRILMFGMVLIMMPLATTEIGTDGWITDIMKPIAEANGFHSGWVLVYTSVIMMVLRFFAGPIVHALSPLPLLAVSAFLAIIGLYTLSFSAGMLIFVAATLYGIGKTFFWPTMLGVVSEQTPKGGALTLNAISGIGMLAVGVLGFPYIGTLQADKSIQALVASQEIKTALPNLVKDGKLTVVEDKNIYEIINYKALSNDKIKDQINTLPIERREGVQKAIDNAIDESKQGALANMVIFPVIMLIGYGILIGYFQMRGGYQQVHLDETPAPAPEPMPAAQRGTDHPHGITEKPGPSSGIRE
ncbi:MAG: MFS transporter [Planctomycetes bacterium]|nr:MFS transporter [Planctomycetota bacterium]